LVDADHRIDAERERGHMSNPASLRRQKIAKSEDRRTRRSTKDDAATREHLEAYMRAFQGDECIKEFEELGAECWPSNDHSDKG
jgi:hypothetical protein